MSIKTRSNNPNSNSGSLGQFMRSRENMFFTAKSFFRNPLAFLAEQQHKPFAGPQWLAHAGSAYNAGRNAAKREKRKAA